MDDGIYIMQRELMERVALEVYSHIKKTKTFIFNPKKGTELMGDVNSNKGFYFSMDGQADTFGERFRFVQYGATDRAYLSVVEDFANIDGIHRAGTDKKYQPLFIERGGYSASPMEKFTVQKLGKNFKGVAVGSSSDDVVSSEISMITPKKTVSMNITDEPIDNVFIAKGGLLGILALWTNELDSYKKLFVNN
ncbi:hypothetical protein [Tenacibaculum phage PTm5]|nr:hypothetical protein [Tenacibaculum phage PTm5]